MMKQNQVITLMAKSCLMAVLLSSCSQGSQPSQSQNGAQSSAPVGIVSYKYIDQIFSANYTSNNSGQNLRAVTDWGTCQSPMMTDAIAGTKVALLPFAFIPFSSSAIGTLRTINGASKNVLNFYGDMEGNSCPSSAVTMLGQQVAALQEQLSQMQSEITAVNNNFYNTYVSTALTQATSSGATYQDALSLIVGASSGSYGDTGNYLNNIGLMNPANNIESVATPQYMQSAIQNATATLQSNVQNAVIGFAGINYSNSSVCQESCFNTVSQNQNAFVIKTYQSFYDALTAEVANALNNTTSTTNVVSLFDQYNSSISAIFQQSLSVLQQLYQVDYVTNQLNYTYAENNPGASSQQVSNGFLNVAGVHYSYGGNTQSIEAVNFNNAQINLTKFYAAAVNQLYLNTLNYIVTDNLIAGQAYPTGTYTINLPNGSTLTENQPSYQKEIGASVATPIGLVGASFTPSNIMVYQYGGLNNVSQCLSGLNTYNYQTQGVGFLESGLQVSNCPPLVWDASNQTYYNQANYTAQNIQPYVSSYPSSGDPVSLTTNVPFNFYTCGSNGTTGNLGLMSYNGNNFLACLNPVNLPGYGSINNQLSNDGNYPEQFINLNMGGSTYATYIYFNNNYVYATSNAWSSTCKSSYDQYWGWSYFGGTLYNNSGSNELACGSSNTSFSVQPGSTYTVTSYGLCVGNQTSCTGSSMTFAMLLPDGTWIPMRINAYVDESGKKSGWSTQAQFFYATNQNIQNNGYSCTSNNNTLTCQTSFATWNSSFSTANQEAWLTFTQQN